MSGRQWTIPEIAAALGIKPRTVSAYHARGQMPPATGRLGRTPWWSSDDIDAWLARRREQEHDQRSTP